MREATGLWDWLQGYLESECGLDPGGISKADQSNLINGISNAMAPREEYGWVIERGNSTAAEPKYWCAGHPDLHTFSAWTSNNEQAIRFARKIDAERAAERHMPDISVRIAEHGWSAQPQEQREDVQPVAVCCLGEPS